ncbi:serine protease inhibitor 42Dd [Drosophila subpulchrella]|uniref:serine protease inhibitor 42Dd n=1 Tax=Drosophila subpulchrella TaxID=1486046 RepID=UPI0018A139AF|nr:serine protease inhibitor 42Dd [Drosophila subpulchrella]
MPSEWVFLIICLIPMASGGTTAPSLSASPIVFARNLFRALNDEETPVNMMVSPAAARSAMTLVFMGAGGKSAEELRSNLILGVANKSEIAKQHAESWSEECSCAKKGVALRLVTRLYVNEEEKIRPEFNTQAMEFFNAQVDPLNYLNPEDSIKKVNKWMEKQTFYTVRNLFTPEVFSPESSVILVNSLFLRAKWDKVFPVELTEVQDFWINLRQRMELPMMRQIGQFRYGESKKLKSQILQLPFEKSNMTMMIILPKDIDGLAKLEEKLGLLDMNEVAAKSLMNSVDVTLPKFKIECDIDLKVPLQKLGINRVFEPGQADLSGLFAKKTPHRISEARHKLFLNVTETGCETAPEVKKDAQPVVIEDNPDLKVFKADRPFVFAIRNKKNVYFVGHFIRP